MQKIVRHYKFTARRDFKAIIPLENENIKYYDATQR